MLGELLRLLRRLWPAIAIVIAIVAMYNAGRILDGLAEIQAGVKEVLAIVKPPAETLPSTTGSTRQQLR